MALAIVVAVGVLGPTRAGAQQDEGDRDAVPTRSVVVAPSSERVDRPLVLDRLDPQTVLRVRASGFEPDTTGTVMQCLDGSRCRNGLSVRFDEHGDASFQYLVTDEVGTGTDDGRCRLGRLRCTIEIRAGESTQVIDTVFVDEAPSPGMLMVDPDTGLAVGDEVRVTASRFTPGAELTLRLCAAPGSSDARCGTPKPAVPLTIGADGSAQARITIPAEIGADEVACGRRAPCLLVVSSEEVGVWARPAPLAFAEGPSPDYDRDRLVIGLAVALVLGALATWLIRSTDWSPPAEADGAAIDDADYADLDLEAEQFVDVGDEREQPTDT